MENNMEKLIVILWILFAIYILVFLAIMVDLWSGISKAKKRGVLRTSYGFRRTVEKSARYYNLLLVLSIMDAMQVVSIWYFETYYDKTFIMFPFVTLIGAICLVTIEVKSVLEKSEDKVKLDEVGTLAGKIWANKADIQEIAKSVAEYMKIAAPTKTTVKITTEQKGDNNNEAIASTESDVSAN